MAYSPKQGGAGQPEPIGDTEWEIQALAHLKAIRSSLAFLVAVVFISVVLAVIVTLVNAAEPDPSPYGMALAGLLA